MMPTTVCFCKIVQIEKSELPINDRDGVRATGRVFVFENATTAEEYEDDDWVEEGDFIPNCPTVYEHIRSDGEVVFYDAIGGNLVSDVYEKVYAIWKKWECGALSLDQRDSALSELGIGQEFAQCWAKYCR